MTPLLVASRGLVPCRDPLKVATDGFIGTCFVTPVIPPPEPPTGGGGVRRRKPVRPIPVRDELYQEQLKARIMQDDAELTEIIIALLTKGIL